MVGKQKACPELVEGTLAHPTQALYFFKPLFLKILFFIKNPRLLGATPYFGYVLLS